TAKPSRGNGLVLPRRLAPSARVALESPPHIGMRDRLHQLGDLVFKIVVGNDQGADGRPQIAAAGRNRLLHRRLQPGIVVTVGLWMRRHAAIPARSSGGHVLLLFSYSQLSQENFPTDL